MRRLLDLAAGLPDVPGAALRGPTYHAIFALLYGLGLPEADRTDDDDARQARALFRYRLIAEAAEAPKGERTGMCQQE